MIPSVHEIEKPALLLPGDLMLSSAPRGDNGPVTWLIKQLTRVCGEGPTLFTHSAIVSEGGTLDQVKILEQTWPRLREASVWEHYRDARLRFYRFPELSPDQIERMLAYLRDRLGEKYGLWKLLTFAVDNLASRQISRLASIGRSKPQPVEVRLLSWIDLTHLYVCSQVSSQAYAEVTGGELDFGMASPLGVAPDDQDDWCLARSVRAPMIAEFNGTRKIGLHNHLSKQAA